MEDNVAWTSYRCCGRGCASFGAGYILSSAVARKVLMSRFCRSFEISLSVE